MKVNKFLKVCFGVALFLLISLSFNMSNVEATFGEVTSGNITNETLDQLPSTIKVDAKESEYVKANKLIFNAIAEELAKSNIVLEERENTIPAGCVRVDYTIVDGGIADIHNVIIESGNITKQVAIEYSNTSKYSAEDKKYVDNITKNLNLKHVENVNIMEEFDMEKSTKDFLKKQINDDSLVLDSCGAYGDGTYLTSYGVSNYYVFKNDILYTTLSVSETFKSKLVIPDDVESTDEAFIAYATPIFKKYLETVYNVENIEKITMARVDGHNYDFVLNNDFENIDMVVLEKEEGVIVTENILVDNLEEGATITSEPIEEEVKETMIEDIKEKTSVQKILGSYEFKLSGVDKLTDKIDLTFELGNEYDGKTALVSHKKSNNEYEYFERVIEDGKITITVNELSPFVVALIDAPQQPEKDETPNTGAMNGIYFSLIVMSVSAVGATLLKKKLN